ncbi:hypothetical protein PQ465_05760 [Sphingobacterium oryzagri]|uniref:Uncharacterized protein n=1 Tax=Sphingobacterium oryzagri TaxID=3025669 RepID=A0ABY7WNJ9_9SPHI|nr:hypothetical protein [Sphingobacterium sp. KACC 22765]WDF69880.1 hypothetical protein PQ465_05760 [Sphingobacterium sp. KACC 22765]
MKNIRIPFALCALVAILFASCGNPSSSDKKTENADKSAAKELGQFVGAGTDNPSIYFYLQDTHETDSSVVYIAKSLHKQDTVGLQIEVAKNIPAGVTADGAPDDKVGFQTGSIKFSSLGKESDAFVAALGELYKIPAKGGMGSSTITPLVFSSNKKAVDLSNNSTYSFKLFFANSAGAEAEVFGILDLYRRLFELKARDASQYERILSAFEGV